MGDCVHCDGNGHKKKKGSNKVFPCPYCDATGTFIPISEKTGGGYYKRTAPLRTNFAGSRYAGHGMVEGSYNDDYGEPTGFRHHSSLGHTHTPPVTDGEISEVKVYDLSSQKLIRIETHVYQSGRWELLSTVSADDKNDP